MQSQGPHQPNESGAFQELGGYFLVARLGEGGMGEVWRGEREGPGGVRRRVAIKRILAGRHHDPVLRERFFNEARTNARLEHPNVVRMLDFGDQPEMYLVFEFVLGASVASVLGELARRRDTMHPAAAAFIAAEIASALDYVHRVADDNGRPLNIVHRDISPQNVLLSAEGAVKLGDFGVVRVADSSFRTQAGMSVGKLVYMAPEQVLGHPFDYRADIFALGITLWEMLTVRALLPRSDNARAIQILQAGQFEPPSRYNPNVTPALDALVLRALAVDPRQRYQSAGEMGQMLRTFVHSVAPGFGANEITHLLRNALPDRSAPPAAVPLPQSAARTVPPANFGSPLRPVVPNDAPSIKIAQAPQRPSYESLPKVPMRRTSSTALVLFVLLPLVAVGMGVGAYFLFGRTSPPSASASVTEKHDVAAPAHAVRDAAAVAPLDVPVTPIVVVQDTRRDAGPAFVPAPDVVVVETGVLVDAAVLDVVSPPLDVAHVADSGEASSTARGSRTHHVPLPALTAEETSQLDTALRKMRGRVKACLDVQEDSGTRVDLTLSLSDGRVRLDLLLVEQGSQPNASQRACMRSLVETTLSAPETSRRIPYRHRYQF